MSLHFPRHDAPFWNRNKHANFMHQTPPGVKLVMFLQSDDVIYLHFWCLKIVQTWLFSFHKIIIQCFGVYHIQIYIYLNIYLSLCHGPKKTFPTVEHSFDLCLKQNQEHLSQSHLLLWTLIFFSTHVTVYAEESVPCSETEKFLTPDMTENPLIMCRVFIVSSSQWFIFH